MSDTITLFTLNGMEVTALRDLVEQFSEILSATHPTRDPGVARLVPDAYEDGEAAAEFRRLTEGELLARRGEDAAAVRATLAVSVDDPDAPVDLLLSPDDVQAWIRTLAAVRLVIASRLGIQEEDDVDPDDPQFGVYEWLGYRLDGLVTATDPD